MEDNKKINIVGTNNRYMIKKVLQEPFEKRVKKWNLPDDLHLRSFKTPPSGAVMSDEDDADCAFSMRKGVNQLDLINDTQNPNVQVVIREINKKISGYKQQDTKKKLYNEEKFITFDSIIKKMRETELKCRYCKCEMYVLYDKIRDGNQWSVDRVDNDIGHNIDNFHLACLTCNLKRRRTSDDKFLFTKQLSIIKQL